MDIAIIGAGLAGPVGGDRALGRDADHTFAGGAAMARAVLGGRHGAGA